MNGRLALAGLVSLFAGVAAITLTAAAAPTRELHAAPSVIVFSGGPLKTPIVLSDWHENYRLLMATNEHEPVPDSVAGRRQRIDVVMYWGTWWSQYAAAPESLLAMGSRTREAQPGAYYPPSRGRSAVWVFGPANGMPASARRVANEGLAILAAHHIPANTSSSTEKS